MSISLFVLIINLFYGALLQTLLKKTIGTKIAQKKKLKKDVDWVAWRSLKRWSLYSSWDKLILGRKTVLKQSTNIAVLNQPRFVALYLVPFGPPLLQVSITVSPLYTTYGGRNVPSAEPQNITEIDCLELFPTCSAYFTPLLKRAFFVPWLSWKLVSS